MLQRLVSQLVGWEKGGRMVTCTCHDLDRGRMVTFMYHRGRRWPMSRYIEIRAPAEPGAQGGYSPPTLFWPIIFIYLFYVLIIAKVVCDAVLIYDTHAGKWRLHQSGAEQLFVLLLMLCPCAVLPPCLVIIVI